jgi:hypothetical protein
LDYPLITLLLPAVVLVVVDLPLAVEQVECVAQLMQLAVVVVWKAPFLLHLLQAIL